MVSKEKYQVKLKIKKMGGDDYDRYGRRSDDRRDRDSYSRGGDRERYSERYRGDRESDHYRNRGDADHYRGDREGGNKEGWEEVRTVIISSNQTLI